MALRISFSDPFGGSNPAAYACVVGVTVFTDKPVMVEVNIYRDAVARQQNKDALTRVQHTLTIAQLKSSYAALALDTSYDALWHASYAFLKTIPQYTGGVDV